MSTIDVNGLQIPYFKDESEVIYYPIKYILEKVLLKATSQLHKIDKFKPYIKRCIIDFSFKGTTKQECYCMSREGWKIYFKSNKVNKNKTKDKIDRLNSLLEYFGEEKVNFKITKEYDCYTLSCIDSFKIRSPKVKNKECIVCGREFPNSSHFFNKDERIETGIVNICRQCNGGNFLNDNKEDKYIYDLFGLNGFKEYKNNKLEFYTNHITSHNEIKIKLPQNNKDFLLKLIKKLYDEHILSKDELSFTIIKDKLVNIIFKGYLSYMTDIEINEFSSNNDCKSRPWLYPKYKLGYVTYDVGNDIFKRYIKENNIIVNNIFEFKYEEILRKCRLSQFLNNILKFIVQYYDYDYPGYMFKITAVNYYKEKEMRIFDMKWLIEKDFKIPIVKIPLYVTKYSIRRKSNTMYRLIKKHYNNNLFEWINECYPDIFNINDFDINPYRSEFDSLEEAQINDILRSKFNNVIYNSRNTENTIQIYGMIPDWIIIGDKGCILVEYFGLYSENTSTSHRLKRYENKLAIKIDKYKALREIGYMTLHIYPDDLKNNNQELIKKINNMI